MEYLVLYDNEGYKNIHENCQKLLEYAKQNGLSLGDVFYEDVILDDLSTEGYYSYLVKLSIKKLREAKGMTQDELAEKQYDDMLETISRQNDIAHSSRLTMKEDSSLSIYDIETLNF